MEVVKSFLDSSTIHGLSYISQTKKYSRLFWATVVITGFIGAIYLIQKSFQSWSDSPIKTTLETLPITDIRFPKVTVCPPKNTFTDLNYDLMQAGNKTMTEEMKDEIFKYVVEIIEEDLFDTEMQKFHEADRFFNWYHGYTRMSLVSLSPFGVLEGFIRTSASSGVVTTPFYGEKFQKDLVELKTKYKIRVYTPSSVRYNENVTLHFKMEKVSMTGLLSPSEDSVSMDGSNGFEILPELQTITYSNFTPPKKFSGYSVELNRKVNYRDLEILNLDLMPGFRFSWWCTGCPEYAKHEFETKTTSFIRLNLVLY